MLADSHCHLNYKGLAEEQGAILKRARDRGVTAMLNISTRKANGMRSSRPQNANPMSGRRWASTRTRPTRIRISIRPS